MQCIDKVFMQPSGRESAQSILNHSVLIARARLFGFTKVYMLHLVVTYTHTHTHTQHTYTHNRFTALSPGPLGWAGARRELLDFMVQGKINRGRHTDHPAGRHSIRTNQCLHHPPPIFFTGRMPFLPPN